MGIDVADWWNRARRKDGTLKLSSRRLVALMMFSDEDSRFKTEFRGDWSSNQYMQAGIINELRIMRAENAVFAHRDYREPILIKSPSQALADQFDTEQKVNIRVGIMAQLRPQKTE